MLKVREEPSSSSSLGSQVSQARTTTTSISKNTIICDQPHHFLPPPRRRTLPAASQGTYNLSNVVVKHPRSISSLLSRRVRRTMSTTSILSPYLSDQKTRFLEGNGDGWTVVMGNEAGGTFHWTLRLVSFHSLCPLSRSRYPCEFDRLCVAFVSHTSHKYKGNRSYHNPSRRFRAEGREPLRAAVSGDQRGIP